MTIYAVRSESYSEYIEVTDTFPTFWANRPGYTVEEHPDIDPTEIPTLTALKRWLVDHYDDGAHWIVECFSTKQLVLMLRSLGPEATRVELQEHWEVLEGNAREVRATAW